MNLARLKSLPLLLALAIVLALSGVAVRAQTLIYDSTATPFALSSGQFTDVHGGVATIVSGNMVLTPDSGDANQFYRDLVLRPASEDTLNETAVCTIPVSGFTSTNAQNGVILRFQRATTPPTGTYYFASYGEGASPTATIFRVVSGAVSVLKSDTITTAYNAGHSYQYGFSVSGSSPPTLTLTVKDVTTSTILDTNTVTDTSGSAITTSGGMGLLCWQGTSSSGDTSTISAFQSYNGVYTITALAQFNLVCVGNSITYGFVVGGGQITNPYPADLQTLMGGNWAVTNKGYSGQDMDYLGNYNPYPSGSGNRIASGTWSGSGGTGSSPLSTIQALYNSSYTANYMVVCEGTNSIYHSDPAFGPNGYSAALPSASGQTDQDIYNRIQAFCTARTGEGWVVYVGTTIACNATPTGEAAAFNVRVQHVNALLRANHSWCAGLIDFAADPAYSALAATANTIDYQSDGTHPTNAGALRLANYVYSLFSLIGTPAATTSAPNNFATSSGSGTKRRLQ